MMELHQPGDYSYVFSPYLEPVARIVPGETVVVYTQDAFTGRIQGPNDLPSRVLDNRLNPQTGPIYIEGAAPGDTLAVHIEAIEATRDWAVSCFVP